MSFKQFAVPLQLELRPSTWLRAIIAAVHGGVFVALLLSGVGKEAVAIGLAATLVSLMSAHFWARRPTVLNWREDNSWAGTIWRNRVENARVLPSTYMSQALIVLHLEEDTGTRWRVPIASDSLSDDNFRRLKVRLNASGVLNSGDPTP